MINYHNINLPPFIAIYAVGEPSFSTEIASTVSGREIRISNHLSSFQKYKISQCKLSLSQFEEFNSFFRARLGRQYSFRMRDYADCHLHNQTIAEMGHNEAIEVFKVYVDTIKNYNRRITKLVHNSVELKVNDLDLAEAEIDYDKGLIKLNAPLSAEEKLIISAAFDVEVRFSSDSFAYSYQSDGSIMIDNLELIEVKS